MLAVQFGTMLHKRKRIPDMKITPKKKKQSEAGFWEFMAGLIAEKSKETKERVLERLIRRTQAIQRRRQSARHNSTNRSTETPKSSEAVAARSRT